MSVFSIWRRYPRRHGASDDELRGAGSRGRDRACDRQGFVANVPLQTLSDKKYAAAELYGKLANICGDLDASTLKSTGTFKMLTGGDRLRAERKYRDPFTFVNNALPIFAANEIPMTPDQTNAWFERWIIIPMEKIVPAEDRDPDFARKLTQPGELDGLLVKSVTGLRRLLDRGRFELPLSLRIANDNFRKTMSSTDSFFEDQCRQAWGPSRPGPLGRRREGGGRSRGEPHPKSRSPILTAASTDRDPTLSNHTRVWV